MAAGTEAREDARYDVSIFETRFKDLPDAKRAWLGEPGSALEGLGRLAILTEDIVASAASEIKLGRRVGLGWDITKLEYSQFGRPKCVHKVVPLIGPDATGMGTCFDDIYEINPQTSSQWDGFRHYSQPRDTKASVHSTDRVFYGGTTKEEIVDTSNHRIGIQHWAPQGIAGRGILVDYASWAATQSPPIRYSTFSTHSIPFAVLLEVLKAQNVIPKKGDILFVRTGVGPEWDEFSEKRKKEYATSATPEHAGMEACTELLEWLWDSGISAVAGDAISWEVYPTPGEVSMHEYLLAGWGLPIGELFDLEALSTTCKELDRYTFFVASVPLNMPGGVSSPPNALAIF
ncbi:hypothetical protein BJ878DRAFT_535779 [Calycina marina]|uniref:Cyclase n=1 Tax=Calycina marina TaxID=1763456 RepID=A0A9P7YZQ3_9HELO|nr:hypothetical protein BJ878DRAFT_535779 [Calycina marina]